jgi:sulfatase maturation enzyme AslB (radical SAM superfamily)
MPSMSTGSQITERERSEASTVTAHSSGHQFEIQLGHMCNNRCVFCSSGQLTALRLARPIPLDPMIRAIQDARANGARRITFLGGEPTLHRSFFGALQKAVELGFEEIVIFTNGVLLPQPGFIDRITALGQFEWRISIQGGNRDAHVAVTGKPDSFRRIVDGLKLLKAKGQRVTANMCVNELSYRSLPEYPALVREHGIQQLHVDVVRPSSTGDRTSDYLLDVMPRYSAMASSFSDMLTRFDQELPGFDVSIGNLPFCVLPQWAHRIHHGGEQTITQACDDSALEVAVDKYRWHASMRRHVAACDSCVFRQDCTGIFTTYLDLYGDAEFRAVHADELRAQGNVHFVTLLQSELESLPAAARNNPPPGWTLGEWKADRSENHLDVRFLDGAGAFVLFRFDRAASATTRFQLTVSAAPSIAESALKSLLEWIGPRLPDNGAGQSLDLRRLLAEHRQRRLLAQGRTRVRELVERLEALRSSTTWSISGSREEGTGSVVELLNPTGTRVDLIFTIHAQEEQPRISLDARGEKGMTTAMARSAVRDLVHALQEAGPTTAR